jgi:hypothetical protein
VASYGFKEHIVIFLDRLIIEDEGPVFLRNVGKYPTIQRHIPQDLNPQLHRCGKRGNFDICYKLKAQFKADRII